MDDVAIILQGAVSHNTEEIIKYYTRYNCKLILSTYINTINFDTSKYKNLDVCTIALPKNWGWGNRNIQRHSTFNGIKRAKELGIKYSLKSRTDHFFKHPDLLNLFKYNIKIFPLFNTAGQEERIIVPNGGTTLNRLCGGGVVGGTFHISDHWLFGTTNDLYNYFDINNQYWNLNKDFNLNPITATEVEFCQLWMKKMDIKYNTVSELLRDKFIVLDNQSLYYDQVKNPTDDLINVKTDWIGWCDPLGVHTRLWFQFLTGKTYTVEQELELNKHQRLIY